MKDESVPENRTQRIVLKYIRDNPGSSLSRISNTLELNQGTLRYHLKVLEKKELIRSSFKEGKRYYFASLILGIGGNFNKTTSDLNSLQRRLLKIIRANPGITRSGIINKTSDSKVKVNRSLEKLLSYNLINRIQDGGEEGFRSITKEKIISEMQLALVRDLVDGKIDEAFFLRMRNELQRIKENYQ